MNNRIIKFRAWQLTHDKKGQMIQDYCHLGEYSRFKGHDLTNNAQGPIISVMQFTGTTDENRKEIWEGDILKFYNRIGVVVYSTDHAAYCLFTEKDNKFVELSKMIARDVEIIGNIHQNPDLLK